MALPEAKPKRDTTHPVQAEVKLVTDAQQLLQEAVARLNRAELHRPAKRADEVTDFPDVRFARSKINSALRAVDDFLNLPVDP